MAKKVAVINQKGGVGKTTSSVNIAYGLAIAGKRTLLVDFDPQGHACEFFCLEIHDDLTISQVLKDRRFDIRKTIVPAYVNGEQVDKLDVIPSTLELSVTKEEIYGRNHVLKFLDKQLEKILDNYDYIIIDCPPDLGVLTKNAVYTADLIMIPIDYDRKALKGVRDLFNTIIDVKEDEHFSYKILRNGFDGREKVIDRYIERELEPHRENVMNVKIHKVAEIKQASAELLPIYSYNPNSAAVNDYKQFVQELINHG